MKYSIHSGSEALALSPRNMEKLRPAMDERISAFLLVTYSGTWESLQVEVIASSYSLLTLMLKNDGSRGVVLQISGSVHRDTSLILALCELNAGSTQARVTLNLCEEGALAMLRSACIAASRKQFHMQCNHLQTHAEDLVENYAALEEGEQYRMEAIGKIIKGTGESSSHQKARVLMMSEWHSSEVVPVLLTDESDVKANHAVMLGQPDEDQLYYLQACGSPRRQALGLLTVDYVIPITEPFDQEEVRAALKDEVEMRAGLHAW